MDPTATTIGNLKRETVNDERFERYWWLSARNLAQLLHEPGIYCTIHGAECPYSANEPRFAGKWLMSLVRAL
jgi:hypothetical protein